MTESVNWSLSSGQPDCLCPKNLFDSVLWKRPGYGAEPLKPKGGQNVLLRSSCVSLKYDNAKTEFLYSSPLSAPTCYAGRQGCQGYRGINGADCFLAPFMPRKALDDRRVQWNYLNTALLSTPERLLTIAVQCALTCRNLQNSTVFKNRLHRWPERRQKILTESVVMAISG